MLWTWDSFHTRKLVCAIADRASRIEGEDKTVLPVLITKVNNVLY